MGSKIAVLDEITINQIAAGEVIENPSSVVKELVENSLDAGSTEICIEIRGGGRQLIRISDNGCGMSPDDALLCLERHGTSKIRNLEDIYSLSTMGFRGEAVPSIAAISKFTLISCPHHEKQLGTMVIVEGGKILQAVPAARSPGTTIEVKALFFNVPVRKKFQKSPAYDANEVVKVITHLSLGNPEIKFQLISDQKTILSTQACSEKSFLEVLKQRSEDVLGKAFCASLVPVDFTQDEFTIQGWVGLPTDTRPNRLGQHLFINRRAVSSPAIAFAIRQGYGTMLPASRHPIFVLHLQMPGSLVDVNVHPQKKEVRLRQQQLFSDQVSLAISKGLQNPSTVPSEPIDWIPVEPTPPPLVKVSYVELPSEPTPVYRLPPTPPPEPKKVFVQQELHPTRIVPKVLAIIKEYLLVDPATLPEPKTGMCLFDQKAAHRRVLFERLYHPQDNLSLQLQNLLIPHSLNLLPAESALLLDHAEAIHSCGIHTQQVGHNQFVIDALSPLLDKMDAQAFIREMLDQLQKHASGKMLKDEIRKKIALAASESAASSHLLTLFEGQKLIEQLLKCSSPYICPRGKPIMIVINEDEIKKRFLKT